MGNPIGIVAGSGEFPFLIVEEVQKQGLSPVVAGIIGEAGISLKDKTDVFEWIEVGNILSLISFFKKNDVKEAVFAGKVNPGAVYRKEKLDEASKKIVTWAQKRIPSALIQTIIEYMKDEGIRIVDPRQFIAHFFCKVGIMTETRLSPDVEEDIAFGWKIARSIADLDIGQTVVVKD
ncbi:MAG: UDP-2,3-diacylglucosamine diphosphatase LpxI, partial [Candidatus Aminicenantes bacterium]|nr:UDP-2,3-diacylglucosamine diphosphatase LpxI [Candidatus Aminicenantes bacterium]